MGFGALRFAWVRDRTTRLALSGSHKFQRHLLSSRVYNCDNGLGNRVDIVGKDRDLNHVASIERQIGGETRVEVGILESHQSPARPILQTEHVEVFALIAAQVHRVEGARARDPGPSQLQRVHVRPQFTIRGYADQAPEASSSRTVSNVFDTNTCPKGIAFRSLPSRHQGSVASKVRRIRGPRKLSKYPKATKAVVRTISTVAMAPAHVAIGPHTTPDVIAESNSTPPPRGFEKSKTCG